MATYFYEFLVRGKPDGTVAWHVVQAADGTDTFGRPFHDERMLSMSQAQEAGVTLPDILAAVNQSVMVELETSRATIQQADAADYPGQIATLETTVASLQAHIAKLEADAASPTS